MNSSILLPGTLSFTLLGMLARSSRNTAGVLHSSSPSTGTIQDCEIFEGTGTVQEFFEVQSFYCPYCGPAHNPRRFILRDQLLTLLKAKSP